MSELLKELGKIEEKVASRLEAVNVQVAENGEATKSAREELKSVVADLESVSKDISCVKTDLTELQQKGVIADDKPSQKSIGAEFMESEAFKAFKSGSTGKARVEMKNTIVNSGNTVSAHDQLPGVVEGAFRALSIMPTVMQGGVSSNIVYYSRELAWNNNATPQAGEGTAKAESVLTFQEVNTPIQTVAHFLKVSKQALDDSTFLASYIDRRLRHGVMNATESQIVNGDGTGQNFSGWLAAGNSTATDPAGTTDIFGLTNKMKYEVIAADYMPDYFYFNPADWSALESTRRGTGDSAFVGASGAVAYVNNGLTPLLWGLPVVVSNNIPAGTVICKSFDADMYADRQSVVVEMFEQDDTNVQSNLITVRGENRGASLNFRPTAIRTGVIGSIT
jgi:HK97 family phage major capsid protein